ncbi:hypothetical protein C8J57DRAFT_1541129 [Mycena rebaudengoi]|nr:hypothetical protein C8J57DRAFT_1541129 [Mycena rebaudengoi]
MFMTPQRTENTSKYSFVGDIKDLTLLEEAPGEGEDWCIDPHEHIYANICGACVEGDKNSGMFTMDLEQYTTSFADLAKQATQDPASSPTSPSSPSQGKSTEEEARVNFYLLTS